jgi:hypothetical protein
VIAVLEPLAPYSYLNQLKLLLCNHSFLSSHKCLQNVTSAFGAFLDPVADKLMVATVLVLLSTRPVPAGFAAGNTWLLPCLTCGACRRCVLLALPALLLALPTL